MLSIPDLADPTWKFADWMELRALSSPRRRASFAELASGLEIAQDDENEDAASEDRESELRVGEISREFEKRARSMRGSYPFRIGDRSTYLEFMGIGGPIESIYLFCLFLSHASDHSIISEEFAPPVDNRVRDLFQVCCTIAAAGHVSGEAVCLGWPRPEGLAFLEALRSIYARVGDGIPHDEPPRGAPQMVKDGGIDVVAWRPRVEGLGITHYFLGQAASGLQWKLKPVSSDVDAFGRWFRQQVACPMTFGTFVPFIVEPEVPVAGATPEERLQGHLETLAPRFGVVYFRYGIPEQVANGLRQVASGRYVHRAEEIAQIQEWVSNYANSLVAFEAAQ